MQAVPLAVLVERDEEELRLLKPVEQGVAALVAGEGVAQRAVQAVDHGAEHQQALCLGGQVAQQHFVEIAHHAAVRAVEVARGRVCAQRKESELRARAPAFGGGRHAGHFGFGERAAAQRLAERRKLGGVEREIACAEHHALVAQLKLAHAQAGRAAAGHDPVHVRRRVEHQVFKGTQQAVAGMAIHLQRLEAVDHDAQPVRRAVERVEQHGHAQRVGGGQGFGQGHAGRLQRRMQVGENARLADDVGIERQPRHLPLAAHAVMPLRERGRLARAGGGHHGEQARTRGGVDAGHEGLSRHRGRGQQHRAQPSAKHRLACQQLCSLLHLCSHPFLHCTVASAAESRPHPGQRLLGGAPRWRRVAAHPFER